jgi:hypothetical protein
MANKYIIHGATYCGDGTASNEAAGAGQAGAWNDINVFEGTAPAQGTLSAGDVVYIRSKTSAGADITRTVNASNVTLGSANASSGSWITWILDGGTVWSGVDGVLQYSLSGVYVSILRDYNEYVCEVQDALRIVEVGNTNNGKNWVTLQTYTKLKNLLLDFSAHSLEYAGKIVSGGFHSDHYLENVHIKVNRNWYGSFSMNQSGKITLINPDIELTTNTDNGYAFFQGAGYGCSVRIYGGRFHGAGAVTGRYLFGDFIQSGSNLLVYGLDIPREVILSNLPAGPSGFTRAMGLDNGTGANVIEWWGEADSRDDNNYPTLSSFLPNSTSTPWSWKIRTLQATRYRPMVLPTSQLYTDTAATKTITLNLLVNQDFAEVTKETCWITVSYTDDSTGLPKYVSSRDMAGGALDSSTASWSATTYGAVTLQKKQLQVTTPTDIKQDTVIYVELHCTAGMVDSSSDLIFMDPSFVLS